MTRVLTPRRLAYAAVTAVASVAGAWGSRTAASATKPIPIAMLAVDAARGARHRRPVDNLLLAGILGFSAAGDRLMLLEEFETDLDRKDDRLRWGATLFAGAQLCYGAAMWRAGARPRAARLLPRVAVLGESAVVAALHRPGVLPVLGPYGNTLATMSALASDLPGPQPRMRIGGLLFLASDLTIINRRHLISDPTIRRIAETWVLASYFAAQGLLIGGLAERRRA